MVWSGSLNPKQSLNYAQQSVIKVAAKNKPGVKLCELHSQSPNPRRLPGYDGYREEDGDQEMEGRKVQV